MPRRGILVSDINVRTQLRLLATRRILERLIARLAAERSTKEEREVFATSMRPAPPQTSSSTTSKVLLARPWISDPRCWVRRRTAVIAGGDPVWRIPAKSCRSAFRM
jgi:hypothetical protein